jgi:hypothetical protein
MGVYKEYKSHRDPRKFLEKFSKNISSSEKEEHEEISEETPEETDEERYKIPVSRAAMDYKYINNKYQEFLMDLISEEAFRFILQSEKEKLDKFGKGFDNFGFKTKGLSQEREIHLKNLFLKSVKEFDTGLKYFEAYLEKRQQSLLNSANKLIKSGGEKAAFIRQLIGKEAKEIIEDIKSYYEKEKNKKTQEPSGDAIKERAVTEEEKNKKTKEPSCDTVKERVFTAIEEKKIYSEPVQQVQAFIESVTYVPEEEKFILPGEKEEIIDFIPARETHKLDTELLASIPIFSGIQPSEMEEIVHLIHVNTHRGDEILYREGADADKVYIVASGEIALYKMMASSPEKPVILLHIKEGDISGDMGVVDEGPRATNAKVISQSAELLSIYREDFLGILRSYPQISLNLNRIYSFRLRDLLQKLTV